MTKAARGAPLEELHPAHTADSGWLSGQPEGALPAGSTLMYDVSVASLLTSLRKYRWTIGVAHRFRSQQ
jgi:hypothetical protein